MHIAHHVTAHSALEPSRPFRAACDLVAMPPPTDQARWFTEEVDPHRGALRAYVQRAFPGVRDVDDVVQDSLLRIWTARASRQIGCARPLFTIVRPELEADLKENIPSS